MKRHYPLFLLLLIWGIGCTNDSTPPTSSIPPEPTGQITKQVVESTTPPIATKSPTPACKNSITWLTGVDTAVALREQLILEELVRDYNQSANCPSLVLKIVAPEDACQTLQTEEIALIGPMPNQHQCYLPDPLSLTPLTLSPTILWVNETMFKEEKIPLPPKTYEDSWDWDQFNQLARTLTKDRNGNTPNDTDFTGTGMQQYGLSFFPESRFREQLGVLDTAELFLPNGFIELPTSWRDGSEWLQQSLHTTHIIPKSNSLSLINKGRIGMVILHLDQINQIETIDAWDIYPLPSYDGMVHSPLHTQSWYLLDESAEEAYNHLLEQSDILRQIFSGWHPDVSSAVWNTKQEKLLNETVRYQNNSYASVLPNAYQTEFALKSLHESIYSDPTLDLDQAWQKTIDDIHEWLQP